MEICGGRRDVGVIMEYNFVSLGPSCPVAGSMSKYGLRSCSLPFDWLVTSSFSNVLRCIETEFAEFLQKDALVEYSKGSRIFIETKNNFYFIHDREVHFKNEYNLLKEKYDSRIRNFTKLTKQPTCYLRAITDDKELNYVIENCEYIKRVVAKGNSANIIVFLVTKELTVTELPFLWFKMEEAYDMHSIRTFFDNAEDFLDFCYEHIENRTLISNLKYDQEKQERNWRIDKKRYQLALQLLEEDFEKIHLPEKIMIYGLGNIGKQFFARVKDKCIVCCFVEQHRTTLEYEGTPILDVSEICKYTQVPCVVTPTYDFDNIYKELQRYGFTSQIISLEEMLQ